MKKLIFSFLKTGFLLFGFCFLSFTTSNAQCTIHGTDLGAEQNSSNAAGLGTELGQTFTACETGNLTEISIRVKSSNTYSGAVNLWLIDGAAANGGVFSGLPVYQTFNVGAGDVIVKINLSTPFPVVAGNMYSLGYGSTVASPGVSFDDNDTTAPGTYTGGEYLTRTSADAARDLNFSATISPVVATAPIPTMSQWGLLIFGLLILNLGVSFVKQKELN